jgi:hypothetical protein
MPRLYEKAAAKAAVTSVCFWKPAGAVHCWRTLSIASATDKSAFASSRALSIVSVIESISLISLYNSFSISNVDNGLLDGQKIRGYGDLISVFCLNCNAHWHLSPVSETVLRISLSPINTF